MPRSWWTLLDAAYQYMFVGEVKNGTIIINLRKIPVIVTSNYSMEDLMAGQTEQRIEVLKRRIRIIEMRWKKMRTTKKLLYWRKVGNRNQVRSSKKSQPDGDTATKDLLCKTNKAPKKKTHSPCKKCRSSTKTRTRLRLNVKLRSISLKTL